MKTTIIATTIRRLDNWKYFAKNIEKYGHEDVELLICDDRHNVKHEKYLQGNGIPFKIVDRKVQDDFFKGFFGGLYRKYTSILTPDPSFKQLGFLIAAQNSDLIIIIDDDVFPQYDFIKGHGVVNKTIECKEVSSDKGWFNTCTIMSNNQNREIYARGYPYSKRKERYRYKVGYGKVVLNMGMWSNIPDLDAITFLHEDSGSMQGITDIRNTRLTIDRLMIARGTLLPISAMNLAFSPEILPAFYQTLQGVMVGGWKLARYDDIWSGVFAKKVIDSVNDRVTVGLPVVRHEKTPRDIFEDIKKEFIGILISERLYQKLNEIEIKANNYFDGYSQLIEGLKKKEICTDHEIQKYFKKLYECMGLWLKIVEKVM